MSHNYASEITIHILYTVFTLYLQVGVAFSYSVWVVSYSFTLFVVARVIGGISKGNISISTAVVTDVTTPEKRSKGMVSVGGNGE